MRRMLFFGILGALLAGAAPACMVRTERVVVATPAQPRCAQAVWIDAHYEPHGRFVPAHWRCVRTTY